MTAGEAGRRWRIDSSESVPARVTVFAMTVEC
jgi:hypothetical protein